MANFKTGAMAAIGLSYAGWKYMDNKYNISADMQFLKNAGPSFGKNAKIQKAPGGSVVMLWYDTLSQPGQTQKTMFIDTEGDRVFTYADIEELSNRVANFAMSQGWKPGSAVAIHMDNCPEYVAVWLGLSKVGIAAALINNNQKGKALVHAVTEAKSVGLIFGTAYVDDYAAVVDDLRSKGVNCLASYGYGATAGAAKPDIADVSLQDALKTQDTAAVDWMKIRESCKVTDACVYIYTSGTTGLPKACNVSHVRMLNFSGIMAGLAVKGDDVIYGSGMPMYHSAANLGVMALFATGCAMISRPKFSATNHFAECGKYKATVMQYIGELCRYLLSNPEGGADKAHNLRLAVGNGLRPEIWDQFQRRFNIREIGEFYSATEGNAVTINHCMNYEGQGAIGRAGLILSKVMPMNIVKFDVESEQPIRGKDGLCMECGPDEQGELVAPIKKIPGTEVDNFEGYTSAEATAKKVLNDVFVKGDRFFRTGDLIKKDRKGYYYFVDRIGDTFRWKGENVSTMEVSEVLSAFPGIVDANVYGVPVPGKDGKACMVVVTLEEGTSSLDMDKLAIYCRANLPSYAIPVFLRFLAASLNSTGTFKHQKVEYRNEGCDPAKIKGDDKLFWYSPSKKNYEPYGPEQFADISGGRAKL